MKITSYLYFLFVVVLYVFNYFIFKINIFTFTGIVLGSLVVFVIAINVFFIVFSSCFEHLELNTF
jgi:hypothetical protein